MKTKRTIIAGLLALAVLAGCQEANNAPFSLITEDGGTKQLATSFAALKVAKSCDEAETEFKGMLKTQMLMSLEQQRRWQVEWLTNPHYYKGGWGAEMAGGDMSAEEGGAAPAPEANKQAAENYSETNVQTEGVDEADLVKTDGNLLYTLAGNELVIVDGWPAADAHKAGSVAIKGYPYAMFLNGSRVAVLSSVTISDLDPEPGKGEGTKEEDYYYGYWQPATLLTIIDTSNPAKPVIEKAEAFEGYMVSSRRIGDRIYLVQQSYIDLWNKGVQYWAELDSDPTVDEVNAAYAALAIKNSAIIDELELADYMPSRFELKADGTVDSEAGMPIVGCTDMYSSTVYAGSGNLTVVTIDMTGKLAPHGNAVMGDWGNVYASTSALYAASTNWAWSWWWEDDEEEETQINTHIHKFLFDQETGAANYVASGTVVGYTLNQFSFDEFDGILRVATTLPDWGWWNDDEDTSESFVTTLKQEGANLVTVGQVGELGKGETIQSVRFIGDQGYVVTFRQVDPLYVIDLANPAKPVVAGELKIPGFSSYIHPLGNGHLLTIGRDGTEDGQVLGLSFQIFDVTNPAKPTQVAKTTLPQDQNGYSWSEAQWDHHAFVYFAHLGLLAIPVSGYSWDVEYGKSWDWYVDSFFSRLDLYHVSIEGGIKPVGSVTHGSMMPEFTFPEQKQGSYCYMNWSYTDLTQIRRGVFLENFLYSVSKGGVLVHDTENLKAGPVAEVPYNDAEQLQTLYGDIFQCWDNGYYYEEEEGEEAEEEEETPDSK